MVFKVMVEASRRKRNW